MAHVRRRRLALDEVGGSLLAGLWPAELKPQAQYLYANVRARALLAAARGYGWDARPSLHLAFHTAHPQQRLYLDSGVDVNEYVRRWEIEDGGWIRHYEAAEVRRRCGPGSSSAGPRTRATRPSWSVSSRPLAAAPRYLRPGLRLVRTWDAADRRALGGFRALAADVREAVNGGPNPASSGLTPPAPSSRRTPDVFSGLR